MTPCWNVLLSMFFYTLDVHCWICLLFIASCGALIRRSIHIAESVTLESTPVYAFLFFCLKCLLHFHFHYKYFRSKLFMTLQHLQFISSSCMVTVSLLHSQWPSSIEEIKPLVRHYLHLKALEVISSASFNQNALNHLQSVRRLLYFYNEHLEKWHYQAN